MHSDAADLILRSDAIFTAARNELFSGYVVIKNGAIAAMIANGEDIQTWRGERTRFIVKWRTRSRMNGAVPSGIQTKGEGLFAESKHCFSARICACRSCFR